MTTNDLVHAVESSDTSKIVSLKDVIKNHPDPWEIHLALYPTVTRVLNPPFINPHLPKMYHVCRDFLPYLIQRRGSIRWSISSDLTHAESEVSTWLPRPR